MSIVRYLTLIVLACAAAGAARAVTLVDDVGHRVTLAAPARRIVSLVPSVTETICALGACDRLVGTDNYSTWPAAAASVPKVGGPEDPSIELIVRQHPQLVLIGRVGAARQRLESLGITTFVLEAVSYEDVGRAIGTVATLLGEEARGAELRATVAGAVDQVARAHRERAGGPVRVYFEIDSSPYAAGPQSFMGELLTRLGTHNIVSAGLGAFPKLNPEYVVINNPDVILLSRPPTVPLAERPGWSRIRAVREARICTFPDEVQDMIMRPGPRVADGMRAIAACLERVSPSGEQHGN